MMGRRSQGQRHLFYEFHLDEAVPDDHLVRKVDAVLDLSWVHAELAPRARQLQCLTLQRIVDRTAGLRLVQLAP